MDTTKPQPDLQALALAKAIRANESGGNYKAIGDAGTSTGAYQFQPATWKMFAKEILNDENAQMTDANQNAVAYGKIKKWKDSGLGPAEIAAAWNAGEGKVRNGSWTKNVGTTTINGVQIPYNTPEYSKKVVASFKQLYPQVQQQFGGVSQTPEVTIPQTPEKGFLGTNPNDSLYGKLLDNSITRGIQAIFPGEKVGQAIGTLGGYVASENKDQYDLSAPTPLQVAGDVAQGALMVGTGTPSGTVTNVFGKSIPALKTAETVLGRVAQTATVGGVYGATGSVAGGETDIKNIASDAVIGSIVSGGAGLTSEIVSKVLTTLPNRLAKIAFPGLKTPEALDYAVKNTKVGSLSQMIEHNQKSMDSFNNQIKTILTHPDNQGIKIKGTDLITDVLETFPRSEYTDDVIYATLKRQVPSEAGTITKLIKGAELDLEEANRLRQVLDNRTYKPTALDTPEVKAGKELIEAFGNSIRRKVQTLAPETQPIFANFSKEITLSKVLNKLQNKKGSIINMKDLIAMGLGHLSGVGPIAGYAIDRGFSNPAVKIVGAKAVNAVAPAINAGQKTLNTKIIPAVSGGVNSQHNTPR